MPEQIADSGHAGYTLGSIRFSDSPATGNSLIETFRGNRTALEALKDQFKALGATADLSTAGSNLWELTIVIDVNLANASAETPFDSYRWDDEFYTEDVYSNPLVTKPTTYPNIDGFPSPGQPGSVTSNQLATIERIISEYQSGAQDTSDATKKAYVASWKALLLENPWAADVAYFRIRGHTSYELKRPVLTRIRSYSTQYTQRQSMEAVPTVYSSETLVSLESFPDVIKNQMPANPPAAVTPPLTAWGWRKRAQSSEVIPYQAKISETTSWTFAAWPTTFYQHV